jgi:hypothetical protein
MTLWTLGSKIFYIYIFSNQGSLASMVEKTLGDVEKVQKNCVWHNEG